MICRGCGADKPLSEYYESNKARCKECVKASVRLRRATNPKVQEYDRKRGNRQGIEYVRQYREQNPKKYAAHIWINNAVRDGRLTKPDCCSECSGTLQIEGHHDDYDKITEVRWLCALCHKRWHAEHGEAKNPF